MLTQILSPPRLGAGLLTASGAATAAAPFPLSVSGRNLLDAQGNPFWMNGDSAYSLIAQLSGSNLALYLDTMQSLKVNAIIVNLFEHHFATSPPNNALGVAPFSTPEDIRTLNTSYFNHALTVIRAAAARNIVVLLEPFYYGFGGGSEGWGSSALMTRTTGEVQTFGAAIGTALGNEPNVIMVRDGDTYDPAANSRYVALKTGVVSTAARTFLWTSHTGDNTTDYNETTFNGLPQQDLNACYVFSGTNKEDLFIDKGYAGTPTIPWINYEPAYEGRATSTAWQRMMMWAGLIYGGCGSFPGSEHRWEFGADLFGFGGDWVGSLSEEVTQDYPHIPNFIAGRPWYDLAPDNGNTFITSGHGTVDTNSRLVCGRNAANTFAVIYFPAGSGSGTIDKSKLAGTFSWQWYSPRDGTYTGGASGVANSGSLVLTPPDSNDWVWFATVP